jgi:hypothetical protein
VHLCTVLQAAYTTFYKLRSAGPFLHSSSHFKIGWPLPAAVPAAAAAAQGRATGREWELNRPDAKLLDTPARMGDDDDRCGPASLQKFSGEDLSVSSLLPSKGLAWDPPDLWSGPE